jgi:hypothetical protein
MSLSGCCCHDYTKLIGTFLIHSSARLSDCLVYAFSRFGPPRLTTMEFARSRLLLSIRMLTCRPLPQESKMIGQIGQPLDFNYPRHLRCPRLSVRQKSTDTVTSSSEATTATLGLNRAGPPLSKAPITANYSVPSLLGTLEGLRRFTGAARTRVKFKVDIRAPSPP